MIWVSEKVSPINFEQSDVWPADILHVDSVSLGEKI